MKRCDKHCNDNKRIYARLDDGVCIRANRRAHMDAIIGASIAAFAIYAAAKWNTSEKEKVKQTFRNLNYKVGDREPRLVRTRKTDDYTLYKYHVPYGLVDEPKLEVLEKVLNKPVEVSFCSGKLNIKVFNKTLPNKVIYNWLPSNVWTVPIGETLSGMIHHNFDKIPHMTIAGMTRQGKTVLLKLIISHLINSHPDDVEFYIIDLKGGLEFGKYESLNQVKAVASNVNESFNILNTVQNQIKSDMSQFKRNGYTNITESKITRRRFITVDEGAELVPPSHEDREGKRVYRRCQSILSEIARIGGALGYRLIFATQYPTADTLPKEIKQNADAKISFRLPTEIASRVAIDEQGAEQLSNFGRAIYRTADKHVLQVPYVSDKEIMERLGKYVNSNNEKEPPARTDHVDLG